MGAAVSELKKEWEGFLVGRTIRELQFDNQGVCGFVLDDGRFIRVTRNEGGLMTYVGVTYGSFTEPELSRTPEKEKGDKKKDESLSASPQGEDGRVEESERTDLTEPTDKESPSPAVKFHKSKVFDVAKLANEKKARDLKSRVATSRPEKHSVIGD